ncbi:MAG: exodeoxyribonuclease III [Actinomycetota bacterium]|nr:exodeoxyribonuclease III [Actinomycetota bacterium]
MRVATWNVNSVASRLPRLLDWLGTTAPDVVCLQETKCAADAFPSDEVGDLGYETLAHGDGRWNGVAILSRVGIKDPVLGLPGDPGYPTAEVLEARAVAATCGPLRVWSVYVPNGREPGHDHYTYKLQWLSALHDAVADDAAGASPFVVMGDFNIAPTDDDVWDPGAFVTATHVTPPERAALAALREAGLRDVVGRPMKYDKPFTYWDYRAGMFHKNMGMRIDLVYGNAAFADAVTDAYVDRDARKGTGPSDHAPVVVDVRL